MRRRAAVAEPKNPHVGGCAARCRSASLIRGQERSRAPRANISLPVADQSRRIIMIAASSPTISPETIQELAGTFQGELIRPGDPTYDEARRVWNGMIDRRPAVVARCRGVADVVACVRF